MNTQKRHPETRGLPSGKLALALLVGCGGGADTTYFSRGSAPDSPPGGSVDSTSDEDSNSGEGPGSDVYAMTSNVWGDDGATGYLYTVRSLASGTATLEDAIPAVRCTRG